MSSVLIFDMDGVLVDVSESYRASIVATVEHFTGVKISNELIQHYKNAGGWNDDWELSLRLVKDTAQIDAAFDEVVAVFQKHFLGTNNDGLIMRERWLPAAGLMDRLAIDHQLAIFSGRPRAELQLTLSRFIPDIQWRATVGAEDVANKKPAPDGLLAIAAAHKGGTFTYVGDNVDDARCARAAGVRFIGVAGNRAGTCELLQAEGAVAVIENINQLEEVL